MNKPDILKGLAEAGADVFVARRALDEMERRLPMESTGCLSLRFPAALEVPPETFVSLRCATRADLIAAANYAAQRYLARRERRQRFLDTLYAAAVLAPPLDPAQVVSDVHGVAS